MKEHEIVGNHKKLKKMLEIARNSRKQLEIVGKNKIAGNIRNKLT